jgi:hypothetical protein
MGFECQGVVPAPKDALGSESIGPIVGERSQLTLAHVRPSGNGGQTAAGPGSQLKAVGALRKLTGYGGAPGRCCQWWCPYLARRVSMTG